MPIAAYTWASKTTPPRRVPRSYSRPPTAADPMPGPSDYGVRAPGREPTTCSTPRAGSIWASKTTHPRRERSSSSRLPTEAELMPGRSWIPRPPERPVPPRAGSAVQALRRGGQGENPPADSRAWRRSWCLPSWLSESAWLSEWRSAARVRGRGTLAADAPGEGSSPAEVLEKGNANEQRRAQAGPGAIARA